MLVLKRVDDARRDGDQILAVIAGSAVNHDGRSNGLIAPNPDAQADVLRRAYKDAGINPRTVDYIEAHGTGTVLGDPIEAQALGRVIGRGRPADKPALLGAVKTNVGHLESAAGAASLAKMVLALQHDKLPPSINYAGPNPYIDFDAAHLRVLDTAADWPRYGGYAVAGVSSFGFGGANAHVVLREVLPRDVVEREPEPQPEAAPAAPAGRRARRVCRRDALRRVRRVHRETPATAPTLADGRRTRTARHHRRSLAAQRDRAGRACGARGSGAVVPLAVSAFLTSRKKAAAAELADWMESPEGQASSLESIGRALSRRNHGRSRAVVLAHDHDEAIKGLRAIADGKQKPNVFSTDGPVDQRPGVGDGRFRRAAPQDGQEPVSAQRGLRRVDREGRRADPGRAGLLGARADPRRLARLRHRNQQRRHLRDPDRAGRGAQASRRQTRCGDWPVAGRARVGLLRRRAVAGRRHPGDLLALAPDGRGRGDAVRRVHPVHGARRVLRRRAQDGVRRLPRPGGVRLRRAQPDRHRRPARADRRDRRPRRGGGTLRPQTPDQGRRPHLADGSAAGRVLR